jgi:shikimate dehydrogenase
MLDTRTTLYGLFGDPVAQSLGPAMHNAAFAAMGLNAAYLAFRVKDIGGALTGFRALGMGGASVTLPHKTKVAQWLDEIDPQAEKIGAVNTIVWRAGRLVGFNTDCQGALDALEARTRVPQKRVALLGAGGAARAAGVAVLSVGASLTIYNRSPHAGQVLATELGADFAPLSCFGQKPCDILINATAAGMFPHTEAMAVDPETFGPETVVMDMVYNPRDTRLLAAARAKGCPTIEGLEMFVRQGAAQIGLWTGRAAPLAQMREVVVEALEQGH